MENNMEVPQKIKKIELPCELANSTLGVYPKKAKTLVREDICTPMFTAELFTIAKICQQPKYPQIDE